MTTHNPMRTKLTKIRTSRLLHRLVLRWANMEMAKRMASLRDAADGDAMDDDCQTAMLELLAAAKPRKWAAWRKALKTQNEQDHA